MKRPAPGGEGPPALELADDVAIIRLRRPTEHNRIDPDDIPVLRGHLGRVAAQEGARALVITGTGDASFSSGFTIEAIASRLDRSFEELLDAVEGFPLPTLCAINGSVYGGATDLALCCDFRIGVRGSQMFMPAARFALHYHPGGLRRYVVALGLAQAKRLFLTAQTIGAEEMLRIGFLSELVERDDLQSRVGEYIDALRQCAPGAVASMKRQLNAIAAGENPEAQSRESYEASLRSPELKQRLAALRKPRRG